MMFSGALLPGRLLRRYKRFLADVELDSGERITAHCPNTGSMLGCAGPGMRVWLSRSDSGTRKYPHTWELVEVEPGVRVGIHTGRANRLVEEAIMAGCIPELAGYDRVRREVRYGRRSRIDLVLGEGACYVEVKNVTAAVADGIALFPDAVSTRATRHLEEMVELRRTGVRAVMCFCVQRPDVREVRPADAIDPAYGRALRTARRAGVELIAYRADVCPAGIVLNRSVPVTLPTLDEAHEQGNGT